MSHISNVLFFCILILLSACSSVPQKNIEQIIADAVNNTDKTHQSGKQGGTAEAHIRAAIKTKGMISRQHLIKAAQLLYARDDFKPLSDTSDRQNKTQIQNNNDIHVLLLAARIALISHSPLQALNLLPTNENLSLTQQVRANTIRVQALLSTGHYVDAIRTQIENEQLTTSKNEKADINRSIWTTLSSLPTVTLNSVNNANQTLKGWIDLALVMRNAQSDMTSLQEDILDWGTLYPLHPVSNAFIDQLLNDYIADYSAFNNIAMLLPVDGKFQLAADVITNGFLSAYYAHNKNGIKPNIRFYNTSDKNIDFDSLHMQAIKDGADVIIGPMEKKTINQLVTRKSQDIPILTLNYAEDTQGTSNNVFQFGLLPEDEAKQVAEFAIQQNKRHAVILIPKSDWGNRLADTFQTQFQQLGGEILNQQEYDISADDFSKPIQALFNLDNSNARYKRLKRLLKTKLEFTPRRREDVDMIFIAATHRAARGIIPSLKFHHAGDIQAYATSHVYSGHIDRAADRDLNNLMFCDIPWTITSTNELKKTFRKNWKNQDEYTRLYALGVDTYDLIHNLKYLKKHKGAYFTGETGNIIIDDKNRLHRKLVWAQFKRGKPVYINRTEAAIQN